ncbi:hypothetical protein HDU98_002125 [Podochytrium sp. JEL0797]|nr:hypothetical protein HDU98_002125 [Podochytrium sp. JEL0797]
MPKITYTIGRDRHLAPVKRNFPVESRALLRKVEHCEAHSEFAQLVALFEELDDAEKVKLYATKLIHVATRKIRSETGLKYTTR